MSSDVRETITRRRFLRNAALTGAGIAGVALAGCTKPAGELTWVYWPEDDWFSVPYYANRMVVDYRASTGNVIDAKNRRFLVDPTNPLDLEGGFIADEAAGHPPDIQFLMNGVWGMNYFVFQGKMEPLDSHLTATDTSTMINWDLDQKWNGHHYGVPWYLSDAPWVYNQDVLDAAGVSAPGAGYTWTQFVTDCGKIKTAGYDPVVFGLEDNLMYGHIINQFCKTSVNSEQDFLKWSLGQSSSSANSFNNAGIVESLTKLHDLAAAGYLNADYDQLGLFGGTNGACFSRFMEGNTAFFPTTSTLIPWMSTAVANMGAMLTPVFGSGTCKDKHVTTVWANGVTAAGAHKDTAVDFLKFMREPEEMKRLTQNCGFIPAHNNLPSDITDIMHPAVYQCYQWASSKPCAWLESFLPLDVNFAALDVIHGVIRGTMTPQAGATAWAQAAADWRASSAPLTSVADVQKWVA